MTILLAISLVVCGFTWGIIATNWYVVRPLRKELAEMRKGRIKSLMSQLKLMGEFAGGMAIDMNTGTARRINSLDEIMEDNEPVVSPIQIKKDKE